MSTPQTIPAHQNFVLHARSRRHDWQGTGSLSIKSFVRGQAYYNVGQGAFLVDAESYLILNHEQPYTVTIDDPAEVESFCVFFAQGMAEAVQHSLSSRPETLLDNPVGLPMLPVLFHQRTYRHDIWVTPFLHSLRAALPLCYDEPGWLEEQLQGLMMRLMFAHHHAAHDVNQLTATRPATRDELYRRLHLARDYIIACSQQPLTLEDIAQIACLSPNHLMRTFKQLFGQTPHQFLMARRLRQARRLLLDTDWTITEICLRVGYTSLTSFSGLFRQHFGISPQVYREQNR